MGDLNRATSANLRKAVLSLAKPAPQGGARGSERSSDSSNPFIKSNLGAPSSTRRSARHTVRAEEK